MASFSLSEKLEKCKKVHNDKYDYSLVDYKHSKTKVKIICPIHGVFEQVITKHETGGGCQECGKTKIGEGRCKKARETYVDRAKKQHPHYDYTKTKYKNVRTKVTITCKKHGDWDTDPTKFLISVIGCPHCSRKVITELNKEFGYSWNKTNWKMCGMKAKRFDSFKAYVIKCWDSNTGEVFYKIGRTYNKLYRRFSCKSDMPYKYEPLHIFEYEDSDDAFEKERHLHEINKKNKCTPSKEFGGRYECYSKIDLI